jgi:hypothetical protein
VPSEYEEQVALFAWADLMKDRHRELSLLYAIPNGARVSMGTAVKLKRAGLKAGVPDVCLPVRQCKDDRQRGGEFLYAGLYIELKRQRGGRRSAEQTAWMKALAAEGYQTAVAKGARHAIRIICEYLSLP